MSSFISFFVQATLRFFDVTPVGRIVNRFSSDVYMVDESLPFQANILLMFVFKVLGATLMMCIALPAFAGVIVVVAVLYYFIQVSKTWLHILGLELRSNGHSLLTRNENPRMNGVVFFLTFVRITYSCSGH